MRIRVIGGLCLLALSGLAFLGISDFREYYVPYFLAAIIALVSSCCFLSILHQAKHSLNADPRMQLYSRMLTMIAVCFCLGCFAGGGFAYKAYRNDVQRQDGGAAIDRHDYQTALRLLQPLADQGDDGAQVGIGTMYDHGWGVKQDDAEAVRWYRRAANQGSLYGSKVFADFYLAGTHGLPKDLVWAYYWKSINVHIFDAMWDTGRPVQKFVDQQNKDFAELEARMTPDQIAAAKRLASKWKPKKENVLYCSSRECSTPDW